MTRRPTRWIAAVALCGVGLASCSITHDVDTRRSDPIPSAGAPTTGVPTTDDPVDTGPPVATDVDATDGATVTEPDPTGLPSISDPDDEIVEGALDNGLRYIVRSNDNPGGRVSMRLAVDAGSVDQTDDQDGVAHFLEHMLFNGTEEFPENELVATLRSFGASFGADVNAYTTYDETVYELTMPTQDPAVVDTGLRILEQWLTAATLDPAQVEAERGVVLDEWRGSATSASGRTFDEIESLLLDGSPYEGRDPIGTDTAIGAMTRDPLAAFYDTWYRPDNASVVVVGDIDTGEIIERITAEFGPITDEGALPDRTSGAGGRADGDRRVGARRSRHRGGVRVDRSPVGRGGSGRPLDGRGPNPAADPRHARRRHPRDTARKCRAARRCTVRRRLRRFERDRALARLTRGRRVR